jgi:hypothetical protein
MNAEPASAAVTARPPEDSTSASIVSGPRELVAFTSCPAALNRLVSVLPMFPVPRMSIFMVKLLVRNGAPVSVTGVPGLGLCGATGAAADRGRGGVSG